MSIKSYQDLKVWQKAMDLVVMCYQATKDFPKSEVEIMLDIIMFGLK